MTACLSQYFRSIHPRHPKIWSLKFLKVLPDQWWKQLSCLRSNIPPSKKSLESIWFQLWFFIKITFLKSVSLQVKSFHMSQLLSEHAAKLNWAIEQGLCTLRYTTHTQFSPLTKPGSSRMAWKKKKQTKLFWQCSLHLSLPISWILPCNFTWNWCWLNFSGSSSFFFLNFGMRKCTNFACHN